jgi:hypothetical protein
VSLKSLPVTSRKVLAMQKVEGSSPFIRFQESPAIWGFFSGPEADGDRLPDFG